MIIENNLSSFDLQSSNNIQVILPLVNHRIHRDNFSRLINFIKKATHYCIAFL